MNRYSYQNLSLNTGQHWSYDKRSHFFRFERVSMVVISLKLLKPSGIDSASSLSCPSSVYNCWASTLCCSPCSLTFPMMLGVPKLLNVGPPTLSWAYWSCWCYGDIMVPMAGSSCFCSSVCCLNSSKVPKRLIFRLLRPWGTFLELALSKWIVLPLLSTYHTKSHYLYSFVMILTWDERLSMQCVPPVVSGHYVLQLTLFAGNWVPLLIGMLDQLL